MSRRLFHIAAVFAIVFSVVPSAASPTPSLPANVVFPQKIEPPFASKGKPSTDTLPAVDPLAKVDPRILQELNGEVIPAHLGGQPRAAEVAPGERKSLDKTRFLVFLKAQADLKATTTRTFAASTERRTAVADALFATAQATQGPVKSLLSARMITGNVASYQPFYIFNGFAVEGDLNTVMELAQRDDVERIAANHTLVPLNRSAEASASPANDLGGLDSANWNIDLVDAEKVWRTLGITGTGAVVAIFDTGVDWTHPALQSRYRGYNPGGSNHNYNWFEPDGNLYPSGDFGPSTSTVPSAVCDPHGTHVAGTMVGDGGTATTKIGMAPGAEWIAVPGICGTTMPGYYRDDIGGVKAFQWLMCPTDLTGTYATRDCSKAPDVINNSWGSSDPADDTFRPIVQALRAANIAVVFAAGNPSAGPGSIGSPGSIPEAIAVGATDINDQVASFSGRGPSFYDGVQKPEISAPGVNIKSSLPNNTYENYSGTSMAAPHVAGLLGLMISADLKDGKRDFSVDELLRFMELSSVDLGPAGPDDNYGYGRIDAYNAVRWVLSAGDLKGIVSDANTSAPIGGATVTGAKGTDTFTTRTAANGAYSTTVPGSTYNVTVSAFGYNPGSFGGVGVITGTNSIVNFSLTPMPAATLTGKVLSGTALVNGALVYVDAKPSVSFTTGANGMYTLTLPVGTHTMTVKAKGYRIQHENVTLASGSSAHNFALALAPSILLVEADDYYGWFTARPAHNFFKWSLDQRNYLYDMTAVTNTASLVQLTTVMTPTNYGVVIWIHTAASPGYAGYTTLMQNYLNAGGRLIISGQDIGYYDSSTPFFQNYLHATYLMNAAAGLGDKISGMGFLSGLNLTLNEAAQYSYANTALGLYPDGVTARDGSASPVMTYDNGNGAAALAIDPCNAPYRAVYFAVGYENLGPRAYSRPPQYADVLDRSIQWVIGSKPNYGVNATVMPGSKTLPSGSVFIYTLTVANTGVNTDTYNLPLAGNAWPTRILSGTTPVAQTLPLAACGQQTLGIEVTIPAAAVPGTSDTVTVTATSQASPSVNSSASRKTMAFPVWKVETPMPTTRYRLAAASLPGTPYYFALGGLDWSGALATNERYNACSNTWTAMAPMPDIRGNINAAALNGRLYVVGGFSLALTFYDSTFVYDPATNSWSSAAKLPVALGGVAIAAANGKLYAFGGSGASGFSSATYEYTPGTNSWTIKAPMPGGPRGYAAAAELGGKIYVVGGWENLKVVEVYDPARNTWSTAASMNVGRQAPGLTNAPDGHLYVSGGGNGWMGLNSAERYNPATDTWTTISSLNNSNRAGSASAYVAGRVFAVGDSGFSDTNINESLHITDTLCNSNKQAQQAFVQPGDRLTYTIKLYSDSVAIANASVLDPIPAGTTFGGFGPATISPAPIYNIGKSRVEWHGAIPANQPPVTFTFGVVVSPTGWVNGQRFANRATFSDGGSRNFGMSANTTIAIVNLSSSTKSVDKVMAKSGDVLTYAIRVQNSAAQAGSATLSDPLPANTIYVPGSLTYTMGSAGFANGVITWTGTLPGAILEPTINYEYGDNFRGGTLPGVTFSWQDMTGATNTGISADDGVFGIFPINFTFNFYGDDYTQFYVSPNGWVGFSRTNASIVFCGSYGSSDTPNNFIGGFGGDRAVYASDGGSITYKLFGSAPNRYLVVQFTKMRYYWASDSDFLDMQIILYESDNRILMQYRNLTTAPTSAYVGLEGPEPAFPYVLYENTCPATNITNTLAVMFKPKVTLAPVDITFAVTTAPMPANTWITNTTTFTDNLGIVNHRTAGTLVNLVNLSTSTKAIDRSKAAVGDPVNYIVVLRNTGLYTATGVSLSDPLPASTTWNGVAPACTSGTCEHTSSVITWKGDVAPGGAVTVSFGVTYTTPLPERTSIVNIATINSSSGNSLTRQATFLVSRPNLGAAYKTVSPAMPLPGGVITYTVYMYNSGTADSKAQLVDPLPDELTYVPGSLAFGSGSGSYANSAITWIGSIPATSQIPVQFRATIGSNTARNHVITNTAVVTDTTSGNVYHPQAVLTVSPYWIFLPMIRKQ